MEGDGDINKSLNTLSISESSPNVQNSVSLDDVTLSDKTPKTPTISKRPEITGSGKKNKPPVERPPPHNVTEKIIFCLDTVDATSNINDYQNSSLTMLKRAVEMFVLNKNLINAKHEYAVLSFDKRNVRWNQEFSNNPRDVINSLDTVYGSDCQEAEFNLNPILEQILKANLVPKVENDITVSPPHIVRLILMYNRNCKPILEKNNFKELLTNPYFVVDVILTYEEKADNAEQQQEIFNALCFDEKVYAYKFAVGTNANLLVHSMAKLLAHPLQRPLQDEAVYKMNYL